MRTVKCYAQHYDDFMILNLFQLIGIEKPSYLDLGAHHPTHLSNTAMLYEAGSRGVNVEANPELIQALKKGRPEDKNVCIGVHPVAGTHTFHEFECTGLSSFSPLHVEKLKHLPVKGTVALQCATVNEIVREHCHGIWPNFLNVDIEELDYDVLASAEFTPDNKPDVICVETRPGKPSWDMTTLVCGKGYEIYCRMGANLFFVAYQHIRKAYHGG